MLFELVDAPILQLYTGEDDIGLAQPVFENPHLVRMVSFAALTVCILVCVGACILAILDFSKTDAL